ncbi:adenylosuccinate synthase [Bacteroidota bacterium]
MPVDILVGLQWGDEGKGKIIDILSPDYDVIARFQGGPNAGHTLVIHDKKFVFHTLPSGVIRPQTINILGSGMVIDPIIFKKEIETLEKENISVFDRILISRNAHLILPSHRLLDAFYEELKGDKKIGSTLKGIGPTYQDKIARVGIRVGDILQKGFSDLYYRLKTKHLSFIDESRKHVLEEEEQAWFEAIEFIRKFDLIDAEEYLAKKYDQNANILAEGAQGTLLDINYGTFPFVTSSSTISSSACTGLGISPNKIRDIYGVFKAYTTRVGEGPFITEQNNEIGRLLISKGHEYGSTTGRERRCGWLDLVALKYSIMLNGVNKLIMTKADVLSELDDIDVCTNFADAEGAPRSYTDQYYCGGITPVYHRMSSWKKDISMMRDYQQLPHMFKEYVEFIEKQINQKLWMISVGPERSQTIIK